MKNILLICIDDVRLDIVYGKNYMSMPNFLALSERGVSFANAFTVSTWSPQVAYSVLTGVDVLHTPFSVESEESQTVRVNKFEYNGDSCFKYFFSVGISANCWVSKKFGFNTLFERWYDDRRTPIDTALRLLSDGLPSPWFMYLHLMNVHDRRTKKTYAGKDKSAFNFDRYRQSAYELDERMAEIYSLCANDIVCVYSDHGEYFPIDNAGLKRNGHGHSLCPQLLHVPVVVSAPGVSSQVSKNLLSLRSITRILFRLGIDNVMDVQDDVVSALVVKDEFAKRVRFGKEVFDTGEYVEMDLNSMKGKIHQIALEK